MLSLPDPSTSIWRYMDLAKLIALVKDAALYCPRADTLGDPFEGSYTQPTIDAMREAFKQDGNLTDDVIETVLRQMFREAAQNSARLTYVSCWHMSEYESAAMWAYYVQHGIGVAVRSTIARLMASIKDVPDAVHIGQVHYIDFKTAVIPGGNAFWPIVVKRLSFEHERELRAIILRPNVVGQNHQLDLAGAPDRLLIPVNLSELVEAIYVAPGAWYRDVVQEVMDRFGLECEVRQSSMDDEPLLLTGSP